MDVCVYYTHSGNRYIILSVFGCFILVEPSLSRKSRRAKLLSLTQRFEYKQNIKLIDNNIKCLIFLRTNFILQKNATNKTNKD